MMVEGLTVFDICNSRCKARIVELLYTCDKTENCQCRFCTGKYFEVQKEIKQSQAKVVWK